MVKQCKMLTSLNLRWTRWQRESSLCFQHHEAWRILLTRVWNTCSKAGDARTEMFMSISKWRLKPTFATVFYNVFQTDLKSRMIGIIFGTLVLCCPPHIHPKEIMILDYSCSTYFFCKRQMKRSSTYFFCKRQIKRKDLMIDSVGLVFGRGLVGNILKKKWLMEQIYFILLQIIDGTNLFEWTTMIQLFWLYYDVCNKMLFFVSCRNPCFFCLSGLTSWACDFSKRSPYLVWMIFYLVHTNLYPVQTSSKRVFFLWTILSFYP